MSGARGSRLLGGGLWRATGKSILEGDEEVLVNLRVVPGVKQSGLVTQNVVDQSPHRTVRARSWH